MMGELIFKSDKFKELNKIKKQVVKNEIILARKKEAEEAAKLKKK